MKVRIFYLLCIFVTSILTAQISYDPGYIIDKSGNKIDCFIKNLEWSNNPQEFLYKLDLNSKEIKIGTLNTVDVFVINGNTKYENVTVEIDKSSKKVASMSNRSEPEFVSETLFLKTLIEGKANLYEYQDNQIQRFFYNINGNTIKQLVYKKIY